LGFTSSPIHYSSVILEFDVTFVDFRFSPLWSSIFWDMPPCSTLKVNGLFGGTCRRLFLSRDFKLLLGLFIELENKGNMFLETSIDFQRTTKRCTPDYKTTPKPYLNLHRT
jgi:hypothetical protein